VIGLEGGDLHHNGTHWRSLLISRKDRVPNRNMRTIRRLCAAGSADSILAGSRYLTRNSSPASSPMVSIRRSRIGLVDPSSDHATICYARWPTGKANAHVNEEHVVERRAQDQPPTVVVIDDDPGVRDSLGKLLGAVGFRVSLLGSVSEFLAVDRPEGPACLVLDVRLPGQSGLELQRELAGAERQLPIIFITGHGDIPMSVQAMKGGAIEFLTKPFREQDLLEAIQLGHARDRARLEQERAMADLKVRFETLSPREREVMANVATGRLNKQIAADLGVSEITVKVHRGQVMRKMRASSLPDLARMADQLQLTPPKPRSPGRVA
jgi:FixJ family two-component response regulator